MHQRFGGQMPQVGTMGKMGVHPFQQRPPQYQMKGTNPTMGQNPSIKPPMPVMGQNPIMGTKPPGMG